MISLGSVGWDKDSKYFEWEAGHNPRILVQLYEGRNLAEAISTGKAQGRRVLAQWAGPSWWIPKRNTPVVVEIPDTWADVVGSAICHGAFGFVPPSLETGTDGTRATLWYQDQPVTVLAPEVKMGDALASELAHSKETLLIVAQLVALITNLNAQLLANPVSFTAFNLAFQPLLPAMLTAINAQLPTLPTTKAKGT